MESKYEFSLFFFFVHIHDVQVPMPIVASLIG